MNVFNKNLYFDDSAYKLFYQLWLSYKPNLQIRHLDSLHKIENLNDVLIHLTIYDRNLTSSTFFNLMKHLSNINEIQKLPFDCINYEGEEVLCSSIDAFLSNIKCCSSFDGCVTENDLIDFMKNLYFNSQILPIKHYVNTMSTYKAILEEANQNGSVQNSLLSKNFSGLITKGFQLGKFNQIFNNMSTKSFEFLKILSSGIKNIFEHVNNNSLNVKDNNNEVDSNEIFITFLRNFSNFSFNSFSNQANLSFIHYNWLDEYLSDILTCKLENSDKKHVPSGYIFSIEFILNSYDQKISKLNELCCYVWSNYSFLIDSCSNNYVMDEQLLINLKNSLNNIKAMFFMNDDQLFNNYLTKKGFDFELFKLGANIENSNSNKTKNEKNLVQIMVLGCMLSFIFSPMEPLDPLEYKNLNEKNEIDNSEIEAYEKEQKSINKNKLKNFETKIKEEANFSFPIRKNKADYFLLKSEFDGILKQLCSFPQLNKLISQFISSSKKNSMADEEFKTWFKSLDKFIQRTTDSYSSYTDIIYAPINGISLVGYSMEALYTIWKSSFAQSDLTSLITLLYQYPYKNNHLEMAKEIFSSSNKICLPESNFNIDLDDPRIMNQIDFELCDELNFIALLHIYNSSNQAHSENSNFNLILDMCTYYYKRFKIYKLSKEQEEKVETYKYKTYGQQEVSDELDNVELEKLFPSYSNHFDDFIVNNSLEAKKDETSKHEHEEKVETSNKYLLKSDMLSQAFDIIELIFENETKEKNQVQNNNQNEMLLKTFYRSYSIATTLIKKYNISIPFADKEKTSSLISHMLFTSSIWLNNSSFNTKANLDSNMFNEFDDKENCLYNIYYDSNYQQVLVCKTLLENLANKIKELLNEWKNNPILIEIVKIVNRIKTFQLSDSLMKYLTGLEILLEKSESWQLIASQKYSLEAELKQINELVVEWRKLELKFWLNSLQLEYYEIKKKTAYVWFFNIFAVCLEYVGTSESQLANEEDLLSTLMKFIDSTTTGEYFIRMKCLKICTQIFSHYGSINKSGKLDFLLNSLYSVYNYYDEIFSKLVLEDVLAKKKVIQKEIKDFIDIHKWRDANYWALKQSTVKFKNTLFKTTKKFRSYLNNKLDFASLLSLKNFKHITEEHSKLNHINKKFNFSQTNFIVDSIETKKHFNKMEKFCKKILIKKFSKNTFNRSISEYTFEIYSRYLDLDKASQSIIENLANSKKDKEATEKLKKDSKNLNSQKFKYISDLIKDLNFMGVSYRKGAINYGNQNEHLNKTILFEKLASSEYFSNQKFSKLKLAFSDSENSYFLCTNNFFNFKSIINDASNPNEVHANNNIPVKQLLGYVDHMYHIIHEQKINLNKFINQLINFELTSELLDIITNSVKYNNTQLSLYNNSNQFLVKTSGLIEQVEIFFKNISKNFQSNDQYSIKTSHELIKEKIKGFKDYLNLNFFDNQNFNYNMHKNNEIKAKFKFSFMDNEYKNSLEKLNQFILDENDLKKNLNDLKQFISDSCKPFENILDLINNEYYKVNQKHDESSELAENEKDIAASINQIIESTLKTVENFYKKYCMEDKNEDDLKSLTDKKLNFIEVCYNQLIDDLKLLNIDKINTIIMKTLKPIENLPNLDESYYDGFKKNLMLVNVFINVYSQFISNWLLFSVDSHLKSCKFLNVLIYIFSEFKTKGIKSPQELEDEEEESNENNNKSKKFETDDNQATGLGEGEGTKDVSDQIENEDQLDDASKPNEEKKEKEDDQKPVKEEEKGIEMSDDFEGIMDNVEMEENDENKEEDENEKEEEEELDDQKGEVEDAMDALDNKLWNESENESENENEDNENFEEDLEGKKPTTSEDQSEILAKEDLPNEAKNEETPENELQDQEMNEMEETEDKQESIIDEQEKFDLNDDKFSDQERETSDVEKENEAEDQDEIKDEEGKETENKDEENEEVEEKDGLDEKPSDETEKIDESEEQEAKKDDPLNKPNSSISNNTNEYKNDNMNNNMMNVDIEEEVDDTKQEKEQNQNESLNEEKSSLKVDQNSGESSQINNKQNDSEQSKANEPEKTEKKLGKKDENRVLSDNNQKPEENNFDVVEVDENKPNDNNNQNEQQNLNNKPEFKHINNQMEKHDANIFDAATESQKRKIDHDNQKMELDTESQINKKKQHLESQSINEHPLSSENNQSKTQHEDRKSEIDDEVNMKKDKIESSQEFVSTSGVECRPTDSFFESSLSKLEINVTREQMEKELIIFRQHINENQSDVKLNEISSESIKLWLEYEAITQQLSKELCEQLRLILEPTVCSKLKGDYKTGKRLNMKRVVEYIATDYRKDKIWLRRTKPNKRDYQILLAVDNSCSMGDNHCIQLAYETIATLTNAFNFLEVGQFGLISFGEKVKQILSLQEQFNSDIGSRILSEVNFKDDKTKIAEV